MPARAVADFLLGASRLIGTVTHLDQLKTGRHPGIAIFNQIEYDNGTDRQPANGNFRETGRHILRPRCCMTRMDSLLEPSSALMQPRIDAVLAVPLYGAVGPLLEGGQEPILGSIMPPSAAGGRSGWAQARTYCLRGHLAANSAALIGVETAAERAGAPPRIPWPGSTRVCRPPSCRRGVFYSSPGGWVGSPLSQRS